MGETVTIALTVVAVVGIVFGSALYGCDKLESARVERVNTSAGVSP